MRFAVALLAHLLLAATPTVAAIDNHHLRGGEPQQQHRRANEALMKRMIVTYADGHGESFKRSMFSAASALHVEYEFDALNSVVIMATPHEIEALQDLPEVASMEEDVPRYPMSIFHPETWNSVNLSTNSVSTQADDLPYGLGLVQAPNLWEYGIRGAGVTVCVIDSGIDSTHEDLSDLSGYSGQSSLPWDEDPSGHGTHVAGTIAARDNGIGVVGVAPEASIYVVRVFSDNGAFVFSSGLVAAVNECVSAGAQVINMSLGGPMSSNFENSAFENLIANGVLPVAASGNDGNTRKSYPASYEGVMSVAAVDSNSRLASFSQRNNMVDIAGPGVEVRSTLPMSGRCDVCSSIGSFEYGSISGTSMATPHVSGVAALLLSFQPTASVTEIQQAMINSARDLGSTGRDDSYGYGLVQALDAAEFLNGGRLDGDDSDGVEEDPPTPPSSTNPPPTPSTGSPPTNLPPSPTVSPPTNPTNAPPSDSSCDAGRTLFRLDLTTDQFGSETSWELRRNSDGASIQESGYGNEQSYVEEVCLTTSECYTFTLYDSEDDGLCCAFGRGSYSLTYGGEVIKSGGSFSSVEETTIGTCISGTCGQGLVPLDLFIRTDSYAFEISLQIVDQDGRLLKVASGLESNMEYSFVECVLPEGCYTLTVFDSAGDGLSGGIFRMDGVFIVSFDGVEQSRATSFGSAVDVVMGKGCAPAS